MGKWVFRSRTVVLILSLALICTSVTVALAAPQAPQPSATAAFAPSPVQKFGVVSNIATRYARLGQFKQPMDLITRLGAGVIAEQVKWDYIEQPACGQYSWDYYDQLTSEARAHGLEISAQLGYNNIACQVGQEDRGMPNIGRWKRFVAATVGRYKNDIHKWEVWNEPDNPEFWKGSPQEYVNLLRETYETIKSMDPSAQVSSGACSQLDLVVCNQIIAAGGLTFSDSFSFHPYVPKENFDNGLFQKIDLPHLRDIQQRNANKPIRLTELGWSSADPGAGGSAVGNKQGNYMVRQIVSMLGFLGISIDQVMWYDFRDDGPNPSAGGQYSLLQRDDDVQAHFGLVQSDWQTPKPSFFAFQQMAGHLAGALPMGLADRGDNGTAFRFNRNGTVVDVVWGGGRTSLATESREAQAYDLTGQALPTDVSDGQIHVDVGDDPVYIEHAKKASGASAPPSAPSNASPTGPVTAPGGGNTAPAASNASVPPVQNAAPPATGPVTNSAGGAATWTDPEQRLRLQYPGGWKVTRLPDVAQNLLELDGPDGILFFIDLFDQTGPPDAIIPVVKQVHAQSTIYDYADTFVLDIVVGGEPGKLLNFAYMQKDDRTGPPKTGKLWIVTHGGKEFDFQARNQSAHAGEVDAIVASVTFLR